MTSDKFLGGVGWPRPDGSSPKMPRPVLAGERVRFVGEAVALVVAESRAAALDAAEAVAVDYGALPAVATVADALAPGAAPVWAEAPDNFAYLWRGGDADAVEAAMRSAAHVTHLEFSVSRVTANPIEPRVCWARPERDGRLTLSVSHQSPHALRNALAPILKLDRNALRVVCGDVGGAFGMKNGVHPECVLVAWGARRLGRPICWISDRSEGFLSDEQGRDIRIQAALALDNEGNFTALKVHFAVNIGAYLSGRSGFAIGNMGGIAGAYRTPCIAAEVSGIFTNVVPTAAYRGAGRPEATYAIERLIDVAAHEIGLSPFELRRRNLISPDSMPFHTGLTFTYDSGEFEQNMLMAAANAGLDDFPARQQEARRRGRLRGIGLCNCIEASGGPFLNPVKDMAQLRLNTDGTLTLQAGVMSTGQGLETSLSQLVAERFGVPAGNVCYRQGDTDLLPHGRGSGGSSALFVGGTAIVRTSDLLLERVRAIAANRLEAAAADIEIANGRARIAGTDRSLSLAEIAGEHGIEAEAEFQPTAVTFPNGTHIAEVEIDPDTGQTTLVAYTAVEDLGRVLNQALAEGQVHGGVAQAVGQALGECIVHDRDSAQLLSASFMDYAMPRADLFPPIHFATRDVPTAVNPLGVKGVGEAGTVGALAAVMNAVCDALRPLGIRHFEMPATPARVWSAINAAAKRE